MTSSATREPETFAWNQADSQGLSSLQRTMLLQSEMVQAMMNTVLGEEPAVPPVVAP